MKQRSSTLKQSKNVVEGIGWEVTVALIPAFIILTIGGYYLYKIVKQKFTQWIRPGVPVPSPHLYREADCPVCLQPMSLEISATCGHVFCANCIFEIYQRERGRINCPTCRKPMTTMFKMFQDSDPRTQQETRALAKVKEYNYLYDDNRGILRCIFELPYLWGHIKNSLSNPEFYGYLLRNSWKYRMLVLLVIYIISPFDIIPESIMGAIGLIDDFFIFLIVAALIGQASMSFLRRRP